MRKVPGCLAVSKCRLPEFLLSLMTSFPFLILEVLRLYPAELWAAHGPGRRQRQPQSLSPEQVSTLRVDPEFTLSYTTRTRPGCWAVLSRTLSVCVMVTLDLPQTGSSRAWSSRHTATSLEKPGPAPQPQEPPTFCPSASTLHRLSAALHPSPVSPWHLYPGSPRCSVGAVGPGRFWCRQQGAHTLAKGN